ncbi:MAG: carbon monoxide dehydrogenase subunit G [Rubrivivax sp.]
MKLTGQQTLPATQAQAWEALNDIDLLKACIPGCDSLSAIGEHQYEALVTAAIGPVKAKFKGKLRLEDLNPPNSYTMHFDGQGGAAGHGKGSAQVRLEPAGAAETTLHYTATASVGGKMAQIGSRLVDMAAQKMAKDFFERFTQTLQARNPAPAVPGAAAPSPGGAMARLAAWLRRVFGG